jgi:Ni/Fe-hydrogenase subunit HybB-like protein
MKSTGRDLRKDMVISLSRLLTVFICVLAVLIFLDKMTHLYAPERAAVLYSLTGKYSWIFWCLQIGLVVIVPLFILFNRKLRMLKWIFVASLSVVAGIFFERFFLVIPQAAFPQQYYPGHIEGVYGAVGSFALTPVEMGMSIGIAACLGLLFMLGLKFMKALPEKTAEELAAAAAKLAPPKIEEAIKTDTPAGTAGTQPVENKPS